MQEPRAFCGSAGARRGAARSAAGRRASLRAAGAAGTADGRVASGRGRAAFGRAGEGLRSPRHVAPRGRKITSPRVPYMHALPRVRAPKSTGASAASSSVSFGVRASSATPFAFALVCSAAAVDSAGGAASLPGERNVGREVVTADRVPAAPPVLRLPRSLPRRAPPPRATAPAPRSIEPAPRRTAVCASAGGAARSGQRRTAAPARISGSRRRAPRRAGGSGLVMKGDIGRSSRRRRKFPGRVPSAPLDCRWCAGDSRGAARGRGASVAGGSEEAQPSTTHRSRGRGGRLR